MTLPMTNPSPFRGWPSPEFVTPDMEGPMPWSLLPCGCHLRRPDYEAVLCNKHLAELNGERPVFTHDFDGERCIHCGVNIYDCDLGDDDNDGDPCVPHEPVTYTTQSEGF